MSKSRQSKAVDDVIAWISQHDRLPRSHSGDGEESVYSRLLERTLSHGMHKNHPRLPELEALVARHKHSFPTFVEWWDAREKPRKHIVRVDDLIAWMRNHNKVPVKSSINMEECRLAGFLCRIKSCRRFGSHPRLPELEKLVQVCGESPDFSFAELWSGAGVSGVGGSGIDTSKHDPDCND